jgi:hypothetical protein
MIETQAQLEQARQALVHLEGALGALRDRVHPANPPLFEAMAQDYVAGIQRLRNDIDAYLGVPEITRAAAPLWMVLNGEALDRSDISSRLLSEWLARLRKAIHRVALYLETGTVRPVGRPDQAILDATDLHVLAVQPGSIRIGLRAPATYVQDDLFAVEPPPLTALPARAIERLLRMAVWAASGRTDPPLDDFPDRDEAALLARQVATLAPTPRGSVRVVTFEGAMIPADQPIRMQVDARLRLKGLENLLSQVSEQTVYGVIREIDLDVRRIILRERGPGMIDLKCLLPDDLVPEAERLLDRAVAVTGLVSSASPDRVRVLSIAASE